MTNTTETPDFTDPNEYDLTDPDELVEFLGYVNVWCRPCGVSDDGAIYTNDKGQKIEYNVIVEVLKHYRKVIIFCTRCGSDIGDAVRKELHLPTDTALLHRPTLNITGPATAIAREALEALPLAEAPHNRTFMFNGSPVTVRADGTIKQMSPKVMQLVLSEVARFRLDSGRYDDAPYDTASAALRLSEEVDNLLPALKQVVTVPVLLHSGAILTTPGYDKESELYYAPAVPDVQVPDTVTADDVSAALALIFDDLLVDFPFVADADRAHALALLLLGFVRDLIDGPTPLHWIGAPDSRTGKGKLASCVLAPAYGVPSSGALSEQEAERRKNISAKLSKGVNVVKWDNVRGDVRSQALELALTETRWTDRKLGFNFGATADIDVPILCTWVLTANNATPGGDMRGRTLPISLDREAEDPGRFKPDGGWHLDRPPEVWALDHRAELIRAALVLCRWWVQKGSPAPDVSTVLGGYEDWQRVLGGILEAADVPGFCGNLLELDAGDEDRSELNQMFVTLAKAHGSTPKTASTILTDGTLAKIFPDVRDAKGMGKILSARRNKRAAGFILRRVEVPRKANEWVVEPT